eukprot:GHVN01016904.1.p1 GENE.GHVN01016904.1~~GHVN01016904.1.p1  ORF type:complete len:131 (+),score=16.86 GHVN01016904.1:308-700(+)
MTYRGTSVNEMDQRAALFGSSVYGRSTQGTNKYAAHSSAMMEAANDEHIEDLEAKVQDLKEISIAMRDETQESNQMLGGMNVDFSRVGTMLGNTLRKLEAFSSSGSGRHIWIMMLFIVGLIFVMYILYGR